MAIVACVGVTSFGGVVMGEATMGTADISIVGPFGLFSFCSSHHDGCGAISSQPFYFPLTIITAKQRGQTCPSLFVFSTVTTMISSVSVALAVAWWWSWRLERVGVER